MENGRNPRCHGVLGVQSLPYARGDEMGNALLLKFSRHIGHRFSAVLPTAAGGAVVGGRERWDGTNGSFCCSSLGAVGVYRLLL